VDRVAGARQAARMDLPAVVELRQYTLHPGARDTLVELFDREFVTGQEEAGIRVLGQFRDLDDPDRFVWLRGFPSMAARKEALERFYGGPVWKAHREAANATMVDVSDVLLLRPVGPCDPSGTSPVVYGFVGAPPVVAVAAIATLVTEPAENTFPALPVRAGEDVFVWLARTDAVPPGVVVRQRLRLAPTARSALR
jgi:quinol monooxygenase YgiN